jgi:hypothetical protein
LLGRGRQLLVSEQAACSKPRHKTQARDQHS